jgi:hypothetical protein
MNDMTIFVQRNKICLGYNNNISMRNNPHNTHIYVSTRSRVAKEKSNMIGQSHVHYVGIFLTTAKRNHVHRVL